MALAACWSITSKGFTQHPSHHPRLSTPPPPCPASLEALSWVLTSLQPHLQGQLSLRLRGILYSKGHQGILASTETSRRGKYLGKAFLKLGTWNAWRRKKNKHPGSDFFCSRICPGIQTASEPRSQPRCVEENEATVSDVSCAERRKDT